MGSMSRAAALLLLLRQARAGCDGNCAAPINVTCGSVLVVGDSTTAEYMPELRTLLSNLGVGHIYMANPASDGPCGSSFGLASCIEPYLEYAWSVIVLGWAHRDIKPNSYGVVTVSEYRTNLWETYTSLKGRLAPGGSMVFMTAVPVGASYEKRDNDDAKELNEEALQLFENEDITIIDHYARIVDACRRDPGLACYPETCDCARFQTDGVHGTSEGRWHKAVAVADAVISHYVPTDVGDDCSPAVTEPEIYDDRPGGELALGSRLVLCLAAIGALVVLNACLVVALCRRRRKPSEGVTPTVRPTSPSL